MNVADIKKTIYYLKRNGIRNTWDAVRERLEERKQPPYCFAPVSAQEWQRQRELSGEGKILFSIVVPTYCTAEAYLLDLLESVCGQSYPNWQLVLADASNDNSVRKVMADFIAGLKNKPEEEQEAAGRICYVKLDQNAGIAENTNCALEHVNGDYVALLDHDDVLSADALFEMYQAIETENAKGIELQMLYSDEDKCDGERITYYEPHYKEPFNLDLLLSNNYICHLLVMKTELMQKLRFRPEYDGAQDYDLVLRAACELAGQEEQIGYVPKVLYHWRCHTGSTAANPQSKQYAYDAGLRALQDFAASMGYEAEAVALKHLGFYTLQYGDKLFESRLDVAAVGGNVLSKHKTISGKLTSGGEAVYQGLSERHSGYMHRGVLTQDAEALDIRCIRVRPECYELFERVVGVPYREVPKARNRINELCVRSGSDKIEKLNRELIFDISVLPKDADYTDLSVKLGQAFRSAGYRNLYYPALSVTWSK